MKSISGTSFNSKPLITIGLPVYNGAKYLSKTIDSVLTQEYGNFEVIISDNASEDCTENICRLYASKDARITYRRNPTNIGPVRNGSRILDEASGEFIVFIADHDLWNSLYISKLLQELQQNSSAVLAYSRTVLIDESDTHLKVTPDLIDTRGLDRCQRFSKIIWKFGWGNMVYGLFRTSIYRNVWKSINVIGPDHVLMASLSFHGEIAQVNEPLFLRRVNRPGEDAQGQIKRQIEWFGASKLESLVPYTLMAYEHVNVIKESNVSIAEKEFLYSETKKCFPSRFGREMKKEALQLVSEITKIFPKSQHCPRTQQIYCLDILRLANICRFFYANIKQLNDLIHYLEAHYQDML